MKKVPTILTKQEVKQIEAVVLQDIEEATTPHQHSNAVRNYAVLRVLISAGLRVNELCELRIEEVWPEEHNLKVRGKGGSERYQAVETESTWTALEEWLKVREQIEICPAWSNRVFLTFYGNRLLPREVQKALEVYGQKAGVRKHVHPHIYRHTYGTALLWNGNLRVAQVGLRHEDISSTEIYTRVENPELRRVLIKANL